MWRYIKTLVYHNKAGKRTQKGQSARKCEAMTIAPKKINSRLLELQIAKEILAEIFQIRSSDVDNMIRDRIEENSRTAEQGQMSEDEQWPTTFNLDE